MAELAVEMPNLLKFPMGKLCFDLVLEVIDELEPEDVPELMKVDRRFRCILLQKPARLFGKQIHSIRVKMDNRGSLDDEHTRYQDPVSIRKFAESRPLRFYFLSHKVLLLSQVERCSVLNISEAGWVSLNRKLSALKKAFSNLKQVDELKVDIYDDNFNDFLYSFKAEVTDRASLRFSDFHLQPMLSLINGSLQNCKMISVDLYDNPDFHPAVYSALSKTQLELFVTEVYLGNVKSTIELILNSGIPSGNKEAACFVRDEMTVEIKNLIKNFPEIRQVNEPNIRTFIRDTMMETLRKHRFMDNYCDRSRSGSPRPRSVSPESLSVSEDSRSVSEDSRSDSDVSRSDSDDSRSVSEDSRSDSDDSLSVSAESDYCDRSPPPPAPPRSRPRSVSVSAKSLSVSGDSRYDSDDSPHSLDRSPVKRAFDGCHRASVDGSFDCYLKRIDEKRDCIYVVHHGSFFAKYVSSIQF